jgi:hypothetical protein
MAASSTSAVQPAAAQCQHACRFMDAGGSFMHACQLLLMMRVCAWTGMHEPACMLLQQQQLLWYIKPPTGNDPYHQNLHLDFDAALSC